MEDLVFTVEDVSPKSKKYRIHDGGEPLSFAAVVDAWKTSTEFVSFYNGLLQTVPYEAYFWEHPPLRTNNLDQPYEVVLVDSPTLATVSANAVPFQSYFGAGLVATFANLRGDAILVAPQESSEIDFPHLAAFSRRASSEQILAFWRSVGQLFDHMTSAETRWLSTSGLGVHWLHVRWDLRPKYYTHALYRKG